MDDLEHLAAEAAALDADATPQPAPGPDGIGGPEQAAPADPMSEIVGILEALRAIAKARGFARAATELSDEAIQSVAGALGPLLVKYGITPGDFFGKWREEVMAAIIIGPWLWSLTVAFRLDLEAKAAAAAKEVQPEPIKPANETGQ